MLSSFYLQQEHGEPDDQEGAVRSGEPGDRALRRDHQGLRHVRETSAHQGQFGKRGERIRFIDVENRQHPKSDTSLVRNMKMKRKMRVSVSVLTRFGSFQEIILIHVHVFRFIITESPSKFTSASRTTPARPSRTSSSPVTPQ